MSEYTLTVNVHGTRISVAYFTEQRSLKLNYCIVTSEINGDRQPCNMVKFQDYHITFSRIFPEISGTKGFFHDFSRPGNSEFQIRGISTVCMNPTTTAIFTQLVYFVILYSTKSNKQHDTMKPFCRADIAFQPNNQLPVTAQLTGKNNKKKQYYGNSALRQITETPTDLQVFMHGELDVNWLRANPGRHVLVIVHHLLRR